MREILFSLGNRLDTSWEGKIGEGLGVTVLYGLKFLFFLLDRRPPRIIRTGHVVEMLTKIC